MHQAPVGCACLATAQTKPASSRAIAAVTMVGGLPGGIADRLGPSFLPLLIRAGNR